MYQEFFVNKLGHNISIASIGAVDRMSLVIPPKEMAPIDEGESSSCTRRTDLNTLLVELLIMSPDAMDSSKMQMNVSKKQAKIKPGSGRDSV